MIMELKEIKSVTVSNCCPSIYHEVIGPNAIILVVWMLSFKPVFSLSTFMLLKRICSSSLLSVIRVVSSAYLRLLFLLEVLIQLVIHPAWHSAWCTPQKMVSKQDDNIQPWYTLFSILIQFVVPYLVLIIIFWPACSFPRRQIRWSVIHISSRNFHILLWSTQSKVLE